jgi:hypothetical protein
MPEDDSKIFDVSKPNRVSPDSTSRPVIVGHRPTMADPMVKEKFSDENSKLSHTPIHVSMGDEPSHEESLVHPSKPEIPSIGKEDIEKALASIEPEKPEKSEEDEHENHEPSENDDKHHEHSEEHEEQLPEHSLPDDEEHKDDTSALGFTSIHSLISGDGEDDKKHKGDDSSTMDGGWEEAPPLPIPQGAGPRRRLPKILGWTVLIALIVVIAGYLAIDLGLVKSDANLPFHIFNKQKKKTVAVITAPPKVQTPPPAPAAPVVPDGFTTFKITGTDISFAYPTVWGKPVATADPGFSKRGGTNKTDGTYAYLVSFATNKDVQLATTSSKYLPAARGAQYYDFLEWCTGTNDGKFYKQSLHFTTTAGVDTPGTITCDQGPLTDATKVDDLTIVQLSTKAADGKTVLGDLYTQNLSKGTYPVLRVKDATMKNAADVKKLLGTVKVSSSSSSSSSGSTSANPQ